MHCIHESVYLLPVAFTAALCRKIAFYQHCLTQPGVHIKNICTFYINLGFFGKKKINKARQQNMPTSILCRSNWDPYSPIVSKTCISGVILTQATTASASQSTNSTILLIFIAAAVTISPVLQNSYN